MDKGKAKGIPDATVLEKLFESSVFEVIEPRDQKFLTSLLEARGLHITDAEVLAIARERDGVAVIDDEVVRKIAKAYGVSYVGTPYILMKAILQGLITKERAKQAINEMISAGWRCGVESYSRIIDAIEKL